MTSRIRLDSIRFAKQFVSIFSISFGLCFFLFSIREGGTISSALAASLSLTLFLYPFFFLTSWINKRPLTKWIEVLLHVITLPVILYFSLLAILFSQLSINSFEISVFIVAALTMCADIYLIFQYVRFIKKDTKNDE